MSSYSSLLVITLCSLFIVTLANVPPSKTFKYINEGSFGEYSVEYFADYRVLDIVNFPFTLCFFNSTPNTFILGLRMGHSRSESIMRWVWEANRGKPVRENATLTFGIDGNLVLTDVDGTVAWHTNTANKGVTGLKLLPNGNLVLHDKNDLFVWQSFDHPTDTLLVGQSLRAKGPYKLVSRKSSKEPVDGPYSFVLEGRHWAMYYTSVNSKKPLPYFKSDDFGNGIGSLANFDFYCEPEYGENYAFELGFRINMTNSSSSGTSIFTRPKYNTTYTMFRVDMDGNLRMYTYEPNVDWGAWEVTYRLLDRDNDGKSECKLPMRCGSLGVCEDSQCVACPSPRGLIGWSKECAPPKLPVCKGGANVDYYKVERVEHFTSDYNEGVGPIKISECKNRCNKDCKCVGFFYKQESSKCLVVPELGALVKVNNSSHVGYIKISK
ncbi:epidermis-specific secreted glycoprotein EP1-like [Solanum pennellii]|uniref:Epidermis-specific secreted glycoprotein EP1-like n=1 Tax=Solanum pennellii TaxID=28526 RepID=A0ABM1G2T8_SOLPN|nr:epidermis-specific secreted glycoprotein EP1-like [Solanum pennellii]